MLILAIILFGMISGWIANVILGGANRPSDWGELMIAGIAGSFVGGLLISLIAGDGISLSPSGLIGTVLGAIIVLVVWRGIKSRGQKGNTQKSGQKSGQNTKKSRR